MAEKHDKMVSKYRSKLLKQKYQIIKHSPFVDYRPDIFATKGKEMLFVEVEIESTLHTNHTLHQLEIMYTYVKSNKTRQGVLLVPKSVSCEAIFMISHPFSAMVRSK